MNYPCKLIQDLLPLYYDGVCSVESREIIEEHLSECAECSRIFEEIREADKVSIPAAPIHEMQKADSLKKVKRKILRKQILIAAAALVAVAIIWFGISMPLKLSVDAAKPENISVSLLNGDLIARLHGSFPGEIRIKNVEIDSNAEGKYYMFFNISESKWDRLTTSKADYTDRVLAYKEIGAANIERIYYYTGDFTGIDMLTGEELKHVIEQSTLMWSK